MKHIFVINPCAGKEDSTTGITQKVEAYALAHPSFDYQIYVTQSAGDATRWTSLWCNEHPGQEARFYACGGDGTLNEVVSGIIDQSTETCTHHIEARTEFFLQKILPCWATADVSSTNDKNILHDM